MIRKNNLNKIKLTMQCGIFLLLSIFAIKAQAEFGILEENFIPIIVGDITVMIKLPPDVLWVEVKDLTTDSATINWETKEEATSEILYSFFPDLTAPALTRSLVPVSGALLAPPGGDSTADNIKHSVTITGLQAGTTYYFKIASVDNNGIQAATLIGDFTLKEIPSTTTPASNSGFSPADITPKTGAAVPYWVQYAKSYMTTMHTITHCVKTDHITGNCKEVAGYERHMRKNIGQWRPFFGPNSGNRPGYYLGNFSSVDSVYYTLWYLNTDELSIDYTWVDPACEDWSCNYTSKKIIWPGEINGDWGVVPMSDDILNTSWIAILPPGKTMDENDIGWKNFVINIDQTMVVGGFASGPTSGLSLDSRSSIDFDPVTGRWKVYITGVGTSPNFRQDLSDVTTGIDNLLGYGSFSENVDSIIQEINIIRTNIPDAKFDIVGHSLGALEGTVLYNTNGLLNSSDTVTVLSPPVGIPSSAMLQSTGSATFTAYGGIWDLINGQKGINNLRIDNGVPFTEINTGSTSGAHDRCKYQNIIYGECKF